MTINDATLMAYADGELTPEERTEVERALANDPVLCEKVDAHRRLRAQLSGAYADVPDEPLPERLLQTARSAPRTADVVDFSARRQARWSVREWGAMAASLAGGLIIGLGAMSAQSPMIAVTADGLSARGALARALETQLASDDAGAIRIGLTFRTEAGAYCRTFELNRRGTAGIACRDEGEWSVAMTATQGAQGEVRMAGAPEAVLDAVSAMMEDEPLDAEAEAEARDAGWRANP